MLRQEKKSVVPTLEEVRLEKVLTVAIGAKQTGQ
jgi:hypothetical protein